MNENPPLTAAALTSAAGAVRTAAAREDRLARHAAVADQWNAIRAAGKASGRSIEEMARALLEFQDAIDDSPITYTNRAARRARAKAERKRE